MEVQVSRVDENMNLCYLSLTVNTHLNKQDAFESPWFASFDSANHSDVNETSDVGEPLRAQVGH